AADAFTDLIVAAFGDLPRQKGIGDRGPCGADQVLDATLDLARHAVGRSEAADAYHRFRRETLDESNIGLLESLLSETRGTRIIGERAGDIDVPQIGKLGEHGDDLAPLALRSYAFGTMQFIDRQPYRHRATIA